MKITNRVTGMDAALANIRGMGRQVTFATAKALTKTAQAASAEVKKEMQATIEGGPTSYTLRAIKVTGARKDKLEAVIELRQDAPGKGSIWSRALGHLFVGGARDVKRMERAFTAAGLLPSGMVMVPASNSWAMPLDSYGNAPRGLIVQLIAYFKAFGEQGYRANMTDKRKAKLAKVGKTASGYKAINGVVYFVSNGRAGRAGSRFDQHLPAGIWAKRGTHGADVAPVFLFVKTGRYAQKFDLAEITQRVVTRDWRANFDSALAEALRTAR
jgi:hypothetical protein